MAVFAHVALQLSLTVCQRDVGEVCDALFIGLGVCSPGCQPDNAANFIKSTHSHTHKRNVALQSVPSR